MQDITEEVSRYREAARHLWNTTFRAGPVSWDARDNFSRVASEMFSALVLDPLGSTENRLAEMFDPEPSHFQRIRVVPASEQIQILINRASKANGYWDDPVNRLQRGEADIRFVRFLDWDELGQRDFEYAQVRIVKWKAHPHLVNRFALLEFGQVRFQFLATDAA